MKVSFLVRPDLAYWACDYGKYPSGERHVVARAKAGFIGQIAAATSQGSLLEVEFDDEAAKVAAAAVQRDRDSLTVLAAAIKRGDWQQGNEEQYRIQQQLLLGSNGGDQVAVVLGEVS